MNEIEILHAEDDSSFGCIQEDIVLQILSKLLDLKTLCLCKLVSKRFYLIVSQVDAISLTSSTDSLASPSSLGSYGSAIGSLMLFKRVKALSIQVPSSYDSPNLFKWKVNFKIRPDSFLFFSPNSIYQKKELDVNEYGQEEEEDMELSMKISDMLKECSKDVILRILLLFHVIRLPLLRTVSITDSNKRGKISLNGVKVDELSSWLSSYKIMKQNKNYLNTDCRMSQCYVPLLKLPVSGYIMKGVYLFIMDWSDLPDDRYDRFIKCDDDFEDKDEAAYSEAMMEIFKNHIGLIERLE